MHTLPCLNRSERKSGWREERDVRSASRRADLVSRSARSPAPRPFVRTHVGFSRLGDGAVRRLDRLPKTARRMVIGSTLLGVGLIKAAAGPTHG